MKEKITRKKVAKEQEGMKLLDFLVQYMPIVGTKTAAKKALRERTVKLNGKAAAFHNVLKEGDEVSFHQRSKRQKRKPAIHIPILYEDDDLLIVHKPAGIAANGTRDKTVENILSNYPPSPIADDALISPRVVHRLDVPTAGVLVMARTKNGLVETSKQFQRRQLTKKYHAVVQNPIDAEGTIDIEIEDRDAKTNYVRLRKVTSEFYGDLNLLELNPITGRTHQLRIHLSSIGNPIVGDKMYNKEMKGEWKKGLFLASTYISFEHFRSKKMIEAQIKIPHKFTHLMDRGEKRNA